MWSFFRPSVVSPGNQGRAQRFPRLTDDSQHLIAEEMHRYDDGDLSPQLPFNADDD